MQFMLNIYGERGAPEFIVERFRGYRPVTGPAARESAFAY
jgi:hypothetical protein